MTRFPAKAGGVRSQLKRSREGFAVAHPDSHLHVFNTLVLQQLSALPEFIRVKTEKSRKRWDWQYTWVHAFITLNAWSLTEHLVVLSPLRKARRQYRCLDMKHPKVQKIRLPHGASSLPPPHYLKTRWKLSEDSFLKSCSQHMVYMSFIDTQLTACVQWRRHWQKKCTSKGKEKQRDMPWHVIIRES